MPRSPEPQPCEQMAPEGSDAWCHRTEPCSSGLPAPVTHPPSADQPPGLSSERVKDKRLEAWLGGLWPACPGRSTCHASVLSPSGAGPEAPAVRTHPLACLLFAVLVPLVGQMGRDLGRDGRTHLVSFHLERRDKAAISSPTRRGFP